jgi:hypothetical protein
VLWVARRRGGTSSSLPSKENRAPLTPVWLLQRQHHGVHGCAGCQGSDKPRTSDIGHRGVMFTLHKPLGERSVGISPAPCRTTCCAHMQRDLHLGVALAQLSASCSLRHRLVESSHRSRQPERSEDHARSQCKTSKVQWRHATQHASSQSC